MKIIVALDSFKGSLTAVEVCNIVADVLSSKLPGAEIVIKPMADGGDGTAAALMEADSGQWIPKKVMGPLPDMTVEAGFAWLADRKTAVIEMATASGLALLKPEQLNPLKTTTFGTGQLIKSALEFEPEQILLTVGGSATVDGGAGAAMALGWEFLDENNKPIGLGGGELLKIKRIIRPVNEIDIGVHVLCDVVNPLCGDNGAARVYGPQKGATPEMVESLEKGLAHFAEVIKEQLGKDIINIPGTGAAGGLSAGAIAFLDGHLVSGIEAVIAESGLEDELADADWIITGEGKFDHQSLSGKVVSGIVACSDKTKAKIAVIAGQVQLETQEYKKAGVEVALAGMDETMSLEYAIEHSENLIKEAVLEFIEKFLKQK